MSSWIRFHSSDASVGFGVLEDDCVIEYEGDMFGAARPTGSSRRLDDVRLLSPRAPSKVIE